MHLSNSVSDEYSIIYLARQLEQHAPMPEETEQLVIKKIPFEEAWQMMEDGLITDAMSVAAIQKVKWMLPVAKLQEIKVKKSRIKTSFHQLDSPLPCRNLLLYLFFSFYSLTLHREKFQTSAKTQKKFTCHWPAGGNGCT